jgi:hypothetical protein
MAQNDPRAIQAAEQQRRLAELRERQARFAQLKQQHAKRLPGHGHRTAHRAR